MPVLVAASEGEGFQAPTVEQEFFPEPFLFVGTPFEMNRVMMVRLIAAVALLLLMIWYSRRAKLVPTKGQAAVEAVMTFGTKNIGEEILGKEGARKYQPLLLTLFMGILFMNLTGVIPGLQIAGTSVIGMPLIYALFAYFGFIVAGIKARGFGTFFKEQLMPEGLPKVIYLLMIPIEFLSTFIIRPVTLTIRLMANMMAGHFVLVLCFLGTHYLYFTMSGILGAGLGTLTLLGGTIYVAFEIFIGALQAYIFTILTAVYISMSVSKH